MKKFFIQILFVIIITLLTLSVICIINRGNLEINLKETAILPKGTSVLVLGDSHTECSLDPAYFEGMINCSRSAEVVFYSYAKLRFFLDNNPSIRTVILSYWSGRLSKAVDEYVIGSNVAEMYPVYMPLVSEYSDMIKIIQERGDGIVFWTYYGINKFGIPTKENFNNIFQRRKQLSFVGNFRAEYKTNIEKADLELLFQNHYQLYNQNSPNDFFGNFTLENLHAFLEYAKIKGVRVILFNAPCHAKYNNKIPQPIIAFTDSVAKDVEERYEAIYINWQNYLLADSLFRDYDHINTKGAAIITPQLREELIKLGIINSSATQ